jgi:hypothetical protein
VTISVRGVALRARNVQRSGRALVFERDTGREQAVDLLTD